MSASGASETDWPQGRVTGPIHRLIASRYPTVGVFDDIAESAEDLRAAFLLEAMTNDRFLLLRNRLELLPDGEILSGEGASMVMAAFLHADPKGSRFSDGRLGAWYAGRDLQTAVEETLFHHTRRLRLSEGGFPNRIEMRELTGAIDLEVLDLRGATESHPELYDPKPANYAAPQAFAARLRWPEEEDRAPACRGLVYGSVRRAGGENVCLFRPSDVPRPPVQGDHYQYRWDSQGRPRVDRLTNIL